MIKILVVEDEAIVAESLKEQLEVFEYHVCGLAESGEEALEMIEQDLPDLVLMDINLAGKMDGVATAEQVRLKYQLPVVYLTAYSDPGTLNRAKLTEPFGYLIKPFKSRELHTALEISLYKHRMEKRLRDHERWLDVLLNSIMEGVVTVDLAGRITSLSSKASQLCQVPEEEAVGKMLNEVFQLTEGEDEGCLLDLIDEALQERPVDCLIEEDPVLVQPDGKHVALDAGTSPLYDGQDQLIGAVLTLRDVSLRKSAELQLAEARVALINMLTPREIEILQMMVNGASTKEIAFDLDISYRTVEAHRKNMMAKLRIHDMPMLVRLAITHRLVSVEDLEEKN
jgi:PAS domain S-box-containing protein